MLQKQSVVLHTFLLHFFPSLKQNFIAYHSSNMSSRPDCIFEIHQLWKSSFSWVYSKSHCSCSFAPEIITIGQSSHKMYSNKILNFKESMTILNASIIKSGNLLKALRITTFSCSHFPDTIICLSVIWYCFFYSSYFHWHNPLTFQ